MQTCRIVIVVLALFLVPSVLLLAPLAAHAADEITGFRAVPWGASPASVHEQIGLDCGSRDLPLFRLGREDRGVQARGDCGAGGRSAEEERAATKKSAKD